MAKCGGSIDEVRSARGRTKISPGCHNHFGAQGLPDFYLTTTFPNSDFGAQGLGRIFPSLTRILGPKASDGFLPLPSRTRILGPKASRTRILGPKASRIFRGPRPRTDFLPLPSQTRILGPKASRILLGAQGLGFSGFLPGKTLLKLGFGGSKPPGFF